jgi:hypothetical protein
MRPQTTNPAPAKTIRIMHAALTSGVVLFALMAHFVLKPAMAQDASFPPTISSALLVASLCACAVGLVMRRRVPRRSTDQSADLFWTAASAPALITWALFEGASMLAVFDYARTGQAAALVVAAIGVALMLAFHPARLERA